MITPSFPLRRSTPSSFHYVSNILLCSCYPYNPCNPYNLYNSYNPYNPY